MYKCLSCWFETEVELTYCKKCKEKDSFSFIKQSDTDIKRIINLPKRYNSWGKTKEFTRYLFNKTMLNDFFWWGLVKGSVNLLWAQPWAWKSTFLWQLPAFLEEDLRIMYYSWEENAIQVWNRLERLHWKESPILDRIDLYFGTDIDEFLGLIESTSPDIVVLDSINSLAGISLSVQAEYLAKVTHFLKSKNITWFIIAHINKSGELGWRKTLEHDVDWIFMMEGQEGRTDSIRILKVLKLRFGEADNVVVMSMWEKGFTIIDANEAFKMFIEESPDQAWSIFCPVLEWNQLFLVEVQSILSEANYSFPQRVAIGINKQKLDILVATILKNTGVTSIKDMDVFLNVIAPPSFRNINVDLAAIMSMISSQKNINLKKYVFIGGVWLGGEIRSVSKQETIIKRLINIGYDEDKIITRKNYKNIREVIKKLMITK